MATYTDLAGYRNSSAFSDRCTLAIASYAKYIIGQTNVPAKKYVWALNTFVSPYAVFQQLANAIVLDPTFTGLANGTADISGVTDAQIDSAVQTTINNSGLF